MKLKHSKRFSLIVFFLLLSIVIIANYLLYVKLSEPKKFAAVENSHNESIEDSIVFFSKNLPQLYFDTYFDSDNSTQIFIKSIKIYEEFVNNFTHIWSLANSWVSKKQIVNPVHEEIGRVYKALKFAPIIKADLDGRGTQLKFLLNLEGNQQVIFKPKWYAKEKILEGPVYGGKDRHTSEIIAFYLSIILNQPFAPFCVERNISLKKELLPVGTKRFLSTAFTNSKNRTCIYGKCFYCSKNDAICGDQNDILTGAVIFNVKFSFKSMRSPWTRTYKVGKKAQWEQDKNYCKIIKNSVSKKRLLEIIDTAIFDFLIQNGDRHHYEILQDRILLLDNGKGLGNPNKHHLDILAPLYQCCVLRKVTWKKLLSLNGNKLSNYLKRMPDVLNFLNQDHLTAIDERLNLIYGAIEYCKNQNQNMMFV